MAALWTDAVWDESRQTPRECDALSSSGLAGRGSLGQRPWTTTFPHGEKPVRADLFDIGRLPPSTL